MLDHTNSEDPTSTGMSRRKALARLGLAAGVAYAAPTIVQLDRSASAKVLPSPTAQTKTKGKGCG